MKSAEKNKLALRLFLTCEHASNGVPVSLKNKIKIPQSILDSHRGWDPGTLELAKAIATAATPTPVSALAKSTKNNKVLAGEFSRLVIDLNRTESNPEVFSKWSRENLTDQNRKWCLSKHRKFRQSSLKAVNRILLTPKTHVIHLSVHSFTPKLKNQIRSTGIGILFDPGRNLEAKIARRLIRILKAAAIAAGIDRIRIDANKPYRGTDDGHTSELRKKITPARYSGIEIEVNQKFIRRGNGDTRWPMLMDLISVSVAKLLMSNRPESERANKSLPSKRIKKSYRTRPFGRRIARSVSSRSPQGRR